MAPILPDIDVCIESSSAEIDPYSHFESSLQKLSAIAVLGIGTVITNHRFGTMSAHALIRGAVDYLTAMKSCAAMDGPAYDAAVARQVAHMFHGISTGKTSTDDATAAVTLLSTPCAVNVLSKDDRDKLVICVNNRMDSSGPSSGSTAVGQTHLHIYSYLTNADRSALLALASTDTECFLIMIRRGSRCGLRYWSEPWHRRVFGAHRQEEVIHRTRSVQYGARLCWACNSI